MNETLAPYIKKLLDGGMKTAEEVTKFVETQAPELGKEIIIWGAFSEIVAPLLGLSLVLSAFVLHTKCKNYKFYYASDSGDPPLAIIPVFMLVGGAILFVVQIIDVIYPILAPRLYMLQKISSLIR